MPELTETNKTGMPRLLPNAFRRDGFGYQMVWRQGEYAIYRQTKPHTTILAFEAIRIRTAKAGSFKGKSFPAREIYPPSESWGTDAFTARSLESAHEYVRRLTQGLS